MPDLRGRGAVTNNVLNMCLELNVVTYQLTGGAWKPPKYWIRIGSHMQIGSLATTQADLRNGFETTDRRACIGVHADHALQRHTSRFSKALSYMTRPTPPEQPVETRQDQQYNE